MKCPFKLGAYPFEGGEGCDPECAWLVQVEIGAPERKNMLKTREVGVCAMTLAGSDCQRGPMNRMEL